MSRGDNVSLTVRALDPPFEASHGVMFGLQVGTSVTDPVSAHRSADFSAEIVVRRDEGELDFAGPFVHGRRGDRFLYLSWGFVDPAEEFEHFARSKIKLGNLPSDLVHAALDQMVGLVVEIDVTDSRGQPATGTIAASATTWRMA